MLRMIVDMRIMGYDFYTKMCWLKISPLRFLRMLYIKKQSRAIGGASNRDAVRQQVKEAITGESTIPLLVFPEGGLANGRKGLLQFHKFCFSLDVPIQPIVLHTTGGPIPINLNSEMGTSWGNILGFLFQPFCVYTIEILPMEQRREEEDSLAFAQRVMGLIADKLGIASSPYLYNDKRFYTGSKNFLWREKGFKYAITTDMEGNVNVTLGGKNRKKNSVMPEAMQPREALGKHLADLVRTGTTKTAFCV
eukprot:g3759.t1